VATSCNVLYSVQCAWKSVNRVSSSSWRTELRECTDDMANYRCGMLVRKGRHAYVVLSSRLDSMFWIADAPAIPGDVTSCGAASAEIPAAIRRSAFALTVRPSRIRDDGIHRTDGDTGITRRRACQRRAMLAEVRTVLREFNYTATRETLVL